MSLPPLPKSQSDNHWNNDQYIRKSYSAIQLGSARIPISSMIAIHARLIFTIEAGLDGPVLWVGFGVSNVLFRGVQRFGIMLV